MNKTQGALLIAIVIIIIGVVYLITDKVDFCETSKNDSYNSGFNQGVEQWNSAVIYNINNNGKVPYWVNGSYFELPITLGVQNE